MSGVEHVFGKPRSGKTSYVVHKILEEDLKYINWRYSSCVDYIKNYNKYHVRQLTLPPQRHTVHSNLDIHRDFPEMSSYPISGFEFGVPNKFQKTRRLVPYGVYVFDEAQQYWDSKLLAHLPPWVNRVFELRGHIFLKIYLITQKFMRLHSDIRSTVDTFTLIKKSIHTYEINGKHIKTKEYMDNGRLIKTTFHGVHFEDEAEVLKYIAGDHSVGTTFTETHFGDICNNYNPYEFAVEFEDQDQDFNYVDYTNYSSSELPESWTNYKKIQKEPKNETKTRPNR